MKILYDYQTFEMQRYGGISRYFFEILKGIEEEKGSVSYELPIAHSSNGYIHNLSIAQQLTAGSDYYRQFFFGHEFPGKWRLYRAYSKLFSQQQKVNQSLAISALKRGEYDLFHPTDIDDYFLTHLKGKPFVITIHDLIDEYFPEYSFHVHSNYKTSVKERIIRQATGIIAISQSTRNDIINRFGVEESKIKVIYHGVSGLIKHDQQEVPRIEGRYLLYVGKRTHYKNFYFFLQCAQPFLQREPALKIVCSGAAFNPTETAYFEDLGVGGQIIHAEADDQLLGNLYRHAVAFVYPTLYEGFGMPILEAFVNGCPVLASRSSSLPEVAGDAARYFEPKDISSVRAALHQILTDGAYRDGMIGKGHAQAEKFSWKRTLEETLNFYQTLV
jgi:glycosyltransferase involved in cell wall biosynthesis